MAPPAELSVIPIGMGAPDDATHAMTLHLRILQYNVLSLKGLTAKALLAAGARPRKV